MTRRAAAAALVALAVLAAAGCKPPPPSPEEGKELLERIRKLVARDAADAELDHLLATWDPAALGTSRKELADLRNAGRRARLQALLVDIQLAERDVSAAVAEVESLSTRWGIDPATLTVRVEMKDVPATPDALATLRRKGFAGEARHWIAESQAAASGSDRIASLGMARQALRDGGLTPADAGVTDPHVAEILTKEP